MSKKKTERLQNEIWDVIASSGPESLTGEGRSPIRDDHSANIVQLVQWGHTRLAADHLLFAEINESLLEALSGAIRGLGLKFYMSRLAAANSPEDKAGRILIRFRSYEYLVETALNFFGLESRWLDDDEKELGLDFIFETLASWEELERDEYGAALIAEIAIDRLLAGMELVQAGASMVAKTAVRIRQEIKGSKQPVTVAFLEAACAEITENIYFQLVSEDRCKFGNDYALGLRWLRHLGYEQVSTNPVLAAKAYDDDPSLSQCFKESVVLNECYERWAADPKATADEITLNATLLALWDNLHVYRPIFYNLADTTGGGVVSFQLNPNLAHLAAESIYDAFHALELARQDLAVYDSYLLAGYDITAERARPNMVIKVAASSPAAIKIASTINAYGLGSNITVVYTVGQEVAMILAEMQGMAEAVRKGILPTQLYMTNMGGRFESHLREEALLSLFDKLKKKIGEQKALKRVEELSKANGTAAKVAAEKSWRDKVFVATCFKNGTNKIGDPVIKALEGVASARELESLESDLQKSGTLVARRVWHIFFSEKNAEKWISWLSAIFDLSEPQAAFILSRINYLPASKRKPLDTLWTLTSGNMVHTEFGNHQENVRLMSLQDDFDPADYVESIRDDFGPDVAVRLSAIPDFVKGYEITPALVKIFADAGIDGDFGTRGTTPEQWENYVAVQKTLAEFKAAYNKFRDYILSIFPA